MELKTYYKRLYQAQDEILNLLAKSSCYLYLTGGTALHRFVLQGTRYSDDLDLFTADRGVAGKDEIVNFVKFLKDSKVDFELVVDSPSFKRLILKDTRLKIDLAHDTTEHIAKFNNVNGFLVDNVDNILVNKYDAVFSREQSRDLFDIYTIIKNSDVDFIKSIDDFSKKSANNIEMICARIKSFPSNMIDRADIRVKNYEFLDDFIENYRYVFDNFFNLKFNALAEEKLNKPKIRRR